MGCVSGKPSMDSPPRGLEKLKLENGYVKGGYNGARRSTGQRLLPKDTGRILKPEQRNSSSNYGCSGRKSGGTRGGQDGKLVTREAERGSGGGGGGNASQRITLAKPAGEEEFVDGWPKWLTDNIHKEALAGLVPRSAESYDKLDKVGQGTYSNVYKARERDTGKIVALKKVRFETSEPESVKFMAREITILQKLDHPNIVKLEGLATSRMQYSIYLVFDFMQSDLSRIISRPDERLTEPQVKSYMQQLLSGLQHCHDRGILHRDIKGSNLLIDKNGMLKIADFGLANYYNSEKKRPLTSRVVTLWYRAPELLLNSTDYGIGIDLWSAGCLMAEMFAGRPIMPGRTEVEQLHKIFKLCGTPSEEYWKKLKLSTDFRPPHSYKPNLREAFRDFQSSLGLLHILLALDPAYRGCAGSALQNEYFHTRPLACDLSGLPVIFTEDDDPAKINERRKHRRSKTRNRSQTQRERRRKDQATEIPKGDSDAQKEEAEEYAEPTLKTRDPESSSSPSNPTSAKPNWQGKSGSPPPLIDLSENMSPRSESHPGATKNIKNRPPIPNGKTRSITYNIDDNDKYGPNLVQISVSTQDFRSRDQRKYYNRYEIDN
ncbi:hypothetical protein RJ639_004736 [Escallonia herrerae]|uniref:Protein kinase domain-containing protein n=1 Tax=Escallonia herrerae TaxID=1293975 RepID=A0AA89B0C4_9ASTE|nr:hypothetical protein RJ639_004736 [Escallonia herrerae]